jgi:hypothetical protein
LHRLRAVQCPSVIAPYLMGLRFLCILYTARATLYNVFRPPRLRCSLSNLRKEHRMDIVCLAAITALWLVTVAAVAGCARLGARA